MTVGEWWDRWWPTVTHLRPSTRARDAQYFRTHVRPVFGAMPLGKLDRTSLRSWAANLGSPPGRRPRTGNDPPRRAAAEPVRQRGGRGPTDPAQPGRQAPAPEDRTPRDALPHRRGAVAVWPSDRPRYRSFVLLGGFGGLRLGEMLGCGGGRVDLLRRRVHVAETLVDIEGHIQFGPPKTKAAVRSVPIPIVRVRRAVPPRRRSARIPRASSSSRRRATRSGRRCSAGGRGLPPSREPASLPCASTISGTPPSRCGSLRAPTPSTWRCSPATRRSRSCSIVTVTCTRRRTTSSSRPLNDKHTVGRRLPAPVDGLTTAG